MEKQIKVLVVVTDGTEDIEAVVPIDLFRRAKFDVTVAGEKEFVVFARGLKVVPDTLLEHINETEDFDLIFVPGGAKGVENLLSNEHLGKILQRQKSNNRWISAICAGPLVLHNFKIFDNNDIVTSHPSVKENLLQYRYSEETVVVSNKIVTSRGAGTALQFALKIIEILAGRELAEKIAQDIAYKL